MFPIIGSATSGFESQKFEGSWTIHNFSVVMERQEVAEFIESPVIITVGGFKFCIRLYPNGADEQASEYMAVYFARKDASQAVINAKVRFDVSNSNGEIFESKPKQKRFSQPGNLKHLGWIGFRSFCKSNEVLSNLLDDTLNIQVTGECYFGHLKNRDVQEPESLDRQYINLSNDVKKAKDFSFCTDVALVLDSGRKVNAHKVILSCRSPVFEKMLSTNMTEALSSQISLPDADDASVDYFIEFLYSGQVAEAALGSDCQLQALLSLAHRFQVTGLTGICEERIARSLTTENVCQQLRFADLYQMESLKKSAMQFLINADVLAAVKETDDFRSLGADILSEILLEQNGCGRNRKRQAAFYEFANDSDWGRMSQAQLKRACLERNLPSHGRKSELAHRLKEYNNRETPSPLRDDGSEENPAVPLAGANEAFAPPAA